MIPMSQDSDSQPTASFPSVCLQEDLAGGQVEGQAGSGSQAPLLGGQDLLSGWGISGFYLFVRGCLWLLLF